MADEHRRQVPLRTIAAGLTESGYPIHRDTIWRHCRDHLAPADAYDFATEAGDAAAGLTVAAVAARVLKRWPDLAAEISASLRSEGLPQAADVIFATTPETMRAALIASAGTPACELLDARLLARGMRAVLGNGYPDASRALAAALRDMGGDDLADALDDLAAAVESSDSPAERAQEIQVRALRAALGEPDAEERRRALHWHDQHYGQPSPELLRLAAQVPPLTGPEAEREPLAPDTRLRVALSSTERQEITQ